MVLLSRVPGIQLSGRRLDSAATIRQAFLAGRAARDASELAKPLRQLAIACQEVTIGYLHGKTRWNRQPAQFKDEPRPLHSQLRLVATTRQEPLHRLPPLLAELLDFCTRLIGGIMVGFVRIADNASQVNSLI
jgi:hypothetical protein